MSEDAKPTFEGSTIPLPEVVNNRPKTYNSYTQKDKIDAVQTYIVMGSVYAASRFMKIPEQTMMAWSRQPWWHEMIADLKTQDELQLSARLKKIANRSLDLVEDRLEHGDYVYDQKSGKMRRKPVSMRDSHKVAMDSEQKRSAILGSIGVRVSEEQVDDKLNKLAAKFAAIVNKRDVSNAVEVVQVDGDASGVYVVPESSGPEDVDGQEQH